MGLIEFIKALLSRMLSRKPEDIRRRNGLRRVQNRLVELRLPYYRPKQNYILPAFAQSVWSFARLLRPLAEVVRATVGNSDARIAQRNFDLLLESRLPSAARDRRTAFTYEGMLERLSSSLDMDREIDAIGGEFQAFLLDLESVGSRVVNAEFAEMERFIDLCRHDWERLLGLFDPGAVLDSPDWQPDFSPAEGEQVLPELIDLHYIMEGVAFTETLKRNLAILLERRSPDGAEARLKKLDRLFTQLQKTCDARLDADVLLLLARATKGDPDFSPAAPRERREYFDAYRRRTMLQFDRSLERIRRERHESAVSLDIKSLFGDIEIAELDSYDEENDSLLRRESPHSLPWIKPLRILKTFIPLSFERNVRENAKRVLIEGYFENKVFQNNLANIIYQCERSAGRITEFEAQMGSNQRISITSVRRYVEELRRGKDMAIFLERLVDAVNGKASEIVEDETGLFTMLGDSLGELLADARRAAPDVVTNIRTLAGGRNREILAQLNTGREQILLLMKIMRNFIVPRHTSGLAVEGAMEAALDDPPPAFDAAETLLDAEPSPGR